MAQHNWQTCANCGGKGTYYHNYGILSGGQMERCYVCNGSGKVCNCADCR